LDAYIGAGYGLVIAATSNQQGASCGASTAVSTQLCGAFNSNSDWAIEPDPVITGTATLGTEQVPGSALLGGVTSFSGGTGSYRVNGAVNTGAGAVEVAAWSDGTPLIATRTFTKGNVEVDLNFIPVSSDALSSGWLPGTNGAQLMVNALEVAADYSDSDPAVPEAQSYMMAGAGLFAISLLLKLRS
jgi:hypothetical protein